MQLVRRPPKFQAAAESFVSLMKKQAAASSAPPPLDRRI
jgi:hypothetical protein